MAIGIKNLILPVSVLMFRSIDQNDPSVKENVTIIFGVVVVACVACYIYLMSKIKARNDETPLSYKEKAVPMQKEEDRKNIETNYRDYDLGQLNELFGKQVMMGLVISLAVRHYWASLMPMMIQAINLPVTIYSHNLFKVHVLGEKAKDDLARPWAPPNPFEGMFNMGGGDDAAAKNKKKK